jgi:redox-sensitive bicupin YhaK (pirin superfamily)
MLAGSMRHRDSRGNEGQLVAGSVQWMTAGRGLVHSEMPEQQNGLMWGFQLWVNLPASQKMVPPRYQDIAPGRVPEVELSPGARVRVIAGECGGAHGPVDGVATQPVYLDARLAPHSRLEQEIPAGHNTFAYVYQGEARFGGGGAPLLGSGQLAVLADGDVVVAAAGAAAARFLLVAARPIGEAVARYGPFVMNTRDEIAQAVRDFQEGRLA